MNKVKKVCVCLLAIALVFCKNDINFAKADEVKDAGLINFDILKDENGYWLDYEDLDTSEQIEAYNKLHNIQEDEEVVRNSFMRTQGGDGDDGTVKAKLKYKISGIKKKVIQSFFVYGNALYVTQVANDKGDIYIHKCSINGDRAVVSQTMTITNAGHGTTLAVYNYGGKEYLLVCAKAKKVNEGYYTIQIGRTEFREGTIDATSIKRFCNCNYANDSNTSCDELKQVVANISTDNKLIYFRVEDINGKLMHTAYPLSLFNEQLDKASKNVVSFEDNSTMRNGVEFSFKQGKKEALIPNGLFQGTDITNGRNIYVVSGNMSELGDKKPKPLILAKMDSYGENVKSYNIEMPVANYNPSQCWEAEGIQIINSDYLYVGMSPKSTDSITVDKSVSFIFSIDRSQMS